MTKLGTILCLMNRLVNQRCSNFVIIETAKGGTSSLKRVLKKSPGTDKYIKERKSAMAPLVTLL